MALTALLGLLSFFFLSAVILSDKSYDVSSPACGTSSSRGRVAAEQASSPGRRADPSEEAIDRGGTGGPLEAPCGDVCSGRAR
jgi:hypothetical protein